MSDLQIGLIHDTNENHHPPLMNRPNRYIQRESEPKVAISGFNRFVESGTLNPSRPILIGVLSLAIATQLPILFDEDIMDWQTFTPIYGGIHEDSQSRFDILNEAYGVGPTYTKKGLIILKKRRDT